MPNLTANINFTAVFDTAARKLTLQNTGNYAGVSVTTVWAVRLVEAGVLRTAAAGTATIALPSATDGTIPQLVYEVTCTVNDGSDDSKLTRSFAYSMQPQQPELSHFLDYTAPRLVYADAQEYFQTGYNIPSVVRSWSALRAGQVVPAVSSAAVFDLAVAGNYYAGQYALGLVVTATYKPVAADKQWVTVIATYTVSDAVIPYVWPAVPEILGWVNAADEKCGGCEPGCQPANLYGLFKDNYCAGNYEAATRNLQALYKATHNGQRYKPRQDGGLLVAVQICGTGAVIVLPFIFTTQPTSGTAPTTLTATVSGGISPYMYQWYNGTAAISGATAASYSATGAGSYKVVATDSAGVVITSSVAVVAAPVQTGLTAPSNLRLQRSGNSIFATWDGHADDEDYVVVVSTVNDFTQTNAPGYNSGTTGSNGAGTYSREIMQRALGTQYFVGITARAQNAGLANSSRTDRQVTTRNRLISVSGTSGGSQVSVAGDPGFEVHFDNEAGSQGNPQVDDVQIGGAVNDNITFDNVYTGKELAIVKGGVTYYNNAANQQLTFIPTGTIIIS